MNGLAILGGIAGGIGLFLLGMSLMTDGLKLAAGPALERILARSTRTRLHGLAFGAVVTAVVQSSSAVTLATIGFVNAGLLNLSQALWVLFGANVGTTMTGWLVALVGLQFKIEALALPLIGGGMVLRLTSSGRRGALGTAAAGFGVLFLGIDILQEAFIGLADDLTMPQGEGIGDVALQVLLGVALTVLMQSSSAALAVALTAAQGGLLAAQGAAAVVIGANIGTTVTAILASVGTTPNARRAAAAHIAFNVVTGLVALLLLPWLVGALAVLGKWLGLGFAPAAELALFHTVFNVLGVVIIWPLAGRLTKVLETRFRAAELDEAQPRHLDRTALAVPALALDALEREVRNMGAIALRMLRRVFTETGPLLPALAGDNTNVASLNRAIADFVVAINRSGMANSSAERLPELLRLARYYEAVATHAVEAADALDRGHDVTRESPLQTAFKSQALALLASVDPVATGPDGIGRQAAFEAAERAYEAFKQQELSEAAAGRLSVGAMDATLRASSALRRALDQATKAARLLSLPPSSSHFQA